MPCVTTNEHDTDQTDDPATLALPDGYQKEINAAVAAISEAADQTSKAKAAFIGHPATMEIQTALLDAITELHAIRRRLAANVAQAAARHQRLDCPGT